PPGGPVWSSSWSNARASWAGSHGSPLLPAVPLWASSSARRYSSSSSLACAACAAASVRLVRTAFSEACSSYSDMVADRGSEPRRVTLGGRDAGLDGALGAGDALNGLGEQSVCLADVLLRAALGRHRQCLLRFLEGLRGLLKCGDAGGSLLVRGGDPRADLFHSGHGAGSLDMSVRVVIQLSVTIRWQACGGGRHPVTVRGDHGQRMWLRALRAID